MADKSLFGRLSRLFSSDVVIRNIGGDTLKVTDVNQIQTTGKYQTNSLVDRFTFFISIGDYILPFDYIIDSFSYLFSCKIVIHHLPTSQMYVFIFLY